MPLKQMAQNCEIHSELVLNLLDELLAELPRISCSLAEELNLQYCNAPRLSREALRRSGQKMKES